MYKPKDNRADNRRHKVCMNSDYWWSECTDPQFHYQPGALIR